MGGLGGLLKLLGIGLTVKEIFDDKKTMDQHHMALLADDEYRDTYRKWWEVHVSVRKRPELMKEMTEEGGEAYDGFRKFHERVMPRRLPASEEAKALARLKRYDELMQDRDKDDPHARIQAWNLALDAIKDDANE